MSTPAFGDTITRVGEFLRYPKRVLIEFLQKAFAEEYLFTNTEGEKVINPFLYTVDEEGGTDKDSKIEICDTWTEELKSTDPRPIITAQRHEMPFGESSIKSLGHAAMPASNVKKFADMVSMPISFNCWSRKDVESEEMAMAVAFILRLFRDIVVARTRIDKITAPVIGGTTPVKTDSEHELFVTPVSITTHMTLSWKLTYTKLEDAKDVKVNVGLKSGE
jgi:hypothetical protein